MGDRLWTCYSIKAVAKGHVSILATRTAVLCLSYNFKNRIMMIFLTKLRFFLVFETINNVNMIWVTEFELAIAPGCWVEGMQAVLSQECYPFLILEPQKRDFGPKN